jgi:hypothetical protein
MVALRRNSQTKLVAVGDSWRALTGWAPVAILLPHPLSKPKRVGIW